MRWPRFKFPLVTPYQMISHLVPFLFRKICSLAIASQTCNFNIKFFLIVLCVSIISMVPLMLPMNFPWPRLWFAYRIWDILEPHKCHDLVIDLYCNFVVTFFYLISIEKHEPARQPCILQWQSKPRHDPYWIHNPTWLTLRFGNLTSSFDLNGWGRKAGKDNADVTRKLE